jgi:hypothetical protein
LWGEIWSCPEIQKNGRLGQDQSGVDIFGIPLGEDGYYGIQCKGKSEYNDHHIQFTEAELLAEIEKAKCFQPPLKKLYFATTALTDSYVQTFIRQKNIEHKKDGLFEIHIFCWDAIVDLIDENRQTHDWYVKQLGYRSSKQVEVLFHDGTKEFTIRPIFKKLTTKYRTHLPSVTNSGLDHAFRVNKGIMAAFARPSWSSETVNLSYASFFLRVKNSGLEPIEDYKLFFEFDGDISDLKDTNEHGFLLGISSVHIYYSTVLFPESKSGKAIPKNPVLVGEDSFSTDDVFVKPLPIDYSVKLKWRLISRDFKDQGELDLHIKPEIRNDWKTVIVSNPSEIKEPEIEFKDWIEPKRSGN